MNKAHEEIWEARGRCVGPFVPGRRLRFEEDDKGYFTTPIAFASDATAPCFGSDDRFYTCPRGIAQDEPAQNAYRWRGLIKDGLVAFIADKPSALVGEFIAAANRAASAAEAHRAERARKSRK